MAIYTSRYANKELKNEGYYPVGISIGSPKYALGYTEREHCYALAPKGFMLKMEFVPYKEAYIKKLEDIGTSKIIAMVRKMEQNAAAEGKKLVLLCFEDIRQPSQWCHRTIFAEWWKAHTGEAIEELAEATALKPKREPKAEKPAEDTQLSLF